MYIEFIKDYLASKVGQVILISDRRGKVLIADKVAKKTTQKALLEYNKKQTEKKAALRKAEQEKANLEAEEKAKSSECKDCQGKTEPCKDCEEKENLEADK